MKRFLPIVSLALIIIATACQKDESTPALTVTQKLTGARWQLRSAVILTAGRPTVDAYATILPCTQDDIVIYDPSGVWYYDEGLTKCDPLDPQTQKGTWQLSSNDTQVTIALPGATTLHTIEELTDTSLHLTRSATQNSIVTTIKLGYVRIP